MLDVIFSRYIIFIAIGVIAAAGLFSRLLVHGTLKRMVKEASNMGKSTHSLMHLVRAKFEHTCMLSDRVQNVDAFVEKYLYEYRVLKIRLHSFRQFEKVSIWLCLIMGLIGASLDFVLNGMSERVLRCGTLGAGAAVVLFVLHIMEDENYQLEAAKVYMVDFLENIYAHRYAKMQQKDKEPEIIEMPVAAPEIKEAGPKNEPEIVDVQEEITAETEYPKAEQIREILEEFLA